MKLRLMATLAVAVICLPAAGYAQKIDDQELLALIENLQDQIDAIQLTPGPRGPRGFTGPAGPAGGDAVFEYVGTAGTPFDGSEGFLTYSRACNAAFQGSRMCTSEEVFRTVNPPQFPGGAPSGAAAPFAWVQPIQAVDNVNGRITVFPGVAEGRGGTDRLSCNGWTSDGVDGGLALDLAIGSFFPLDCTMQLDVACCAPAASP